MRHKVTCMDCGKTERIEVERGKHINSEWGYYGKLNINVCQTDKFFWKSKDPKKILEDMVKVPNPCYDPKVKPKLVELWSCPECMAKLKEEERRPTK